MPNQPKPENVPICFRPGTKPGDPDGDRAWLERYHKKTGKPKGEILSEALAQYRAVTEGRITTAEGGTTTAPDCKHPGVRPKNRCPKCGRYNI